VKAWLVTWDWYGDHAAVGDQLVAILNAGRSKSSVAKYVELLHLLATSLAFEVAQWANGRDRQPHQATMVQVINCVPHGGHITCGHNPWMVARLVSNLVVEPDFDAGIETARWQEPPTYRWQDETQRRLVVERDGDVRELIRSLKPLLSDCLLAGRHAHEQSGLTA